MYVVVGYDLTTGRRKVYEELEDPARAYELATELDAATSLGRDEDDTDKTEHPCRIAIEDEDGNDVWSECCNARCPAVGLFQ